MEFVGSSEPVTQERREVLDQAVQQVGDNAEVLEIGSRSLRQIKLLYPDDYEILLEKLYTIDDGLIRDVIQQDWTNAGYLFEHVYPIGEFTDCDRLAAELDSIGDGFGHRKLFGYSFDPGHVHIYHDCPYSNRSCRCAFKRRFRGIKTKNQTQRRPCSELREEWLSFFIYYHLRKGGRQQSWCGGTRQRLVGACKY